MGVHVYIFAIIFQKYTSLMLLSKFSYRPLSDDRWAKIGEIGRLSGYWRSIVDRFLKRFWLIFFCLNFFCRRNKVKSFVDRFYWFSGSLSSVKRRTMVALWSTDIRPTSWWTFHPDIGRTSHANRVSLIKESSARQSPNIGRWSFDCRSVICMDSC